MQNGLIEKTGKIAIEVFKGSYRLRWTYNRKTQTLTIGRVSKDSLKIAKAKASQVDLDIMTGNYDETLVKYDARRVKQTITDSPTEETLLTVWESYKNISKKSVALTTQKDCWSQTDRCLEKAKDAKLFEFRNAPDLLAELLNHYSVSTIERVLADINAACSLAVDMEKIEKNPYRKLKRFLPDVTSNGGENERTKQSFTDNDLITILDAFKTNQFQNINSPYAHSYYYPFIQFCTLTGCRPGEAIALTWDDIKYKDERVWVSINKSYSSGILKCTKTGETRLFPVNDELLKVIESFPRISNENNLMFPSVRGGYIDQSLFSRRYWRTIVLKLAANELIERYLPPYNLRHSYITRLIRLGVDVATVGRICGTSPEMIVGHYLSPNDDYIPPNLGLILSV
ncbi:site-specific integrase [Planktothrix sp. FACHB-1365]|uniref:tyrosine-type recombinase/integrase n=1 Tax=Planktothrix sp. FACHB-1365 TaxID=2692855 RepID=UPI001686280B|nr:site-specific integrase [Planktothrix sp. FACHB-1365]MBD2485713.1 site-specific integrase [Planktothrix sp. FACHB-1365]